MNRFWDLVLRPVVDAVEARCLVEVGADRGRLTRKLLDWASAHDAIVHVIDPHPQFDVAQWQAEHGDRFVFHEARSLNVLERIDGVDAALIDGDHNWFTVLHELRLLERTAVGRGAVPPLIALHDVGWPYGRRDLYYDPDSIPAAQRQPYERKGILPGEGELSHAGLNDHLQNAIYEHSLRNGVRTAVEDFMAGSELDWLWFEVPCLNGLGIIATDQRLAAYPTLRPVLDSFSSAEFLRAWSHQVDLAHIRAQIAVAQRERSVHKLGKRADELEHGREQLELVLAEARERFEAVDAIQKTASAERDAVAHERDSIRAEVDALVAERDSLVAERDSLASERQAVEQQFADQLTQDRRLREQLEAEIDRLEQDAGAAAGLESELRREAAAARAAVDEADVQRHRLRDQLAAATNGAGPVAASGDGVWGQLGVALRSCEEQINQSAPERDPTFAGDASSYLAISRAAVQAIVPALAAASIAQPAAILDVPCGYGRVTRALRAAWPEAELVAADQSTSAVAFCVEQFGAEGWELSDYPALDGNGRQAERFDLIWSASLLSSIDPEHLGELLSSLLSLLRPGGVLVAAYHGRDSARRFGEHPNPELRSLARSVPSRGVGFQPREESATLGTTAMTPDWLLSHLTNRRDAMVLSVIERGWADHLDVVGVTRRDIHHHQADLSAPD